MSNSEQRDSVSGLVKGTTYIFEGTPAQPGTTNISNIQIQAKITHLPGDPLIEGSPQIAQKPRAKIINEDITYNNESGNVVSSIESSVGKSVSIMGVHTKRVVVKKTLRSNVTENSYFYYIDYGVNNPKSFSHKLKGVPSTTSPYNDDLSHLSRLLKTDDTSQSGGARKIRKRRQSHKKYAFKKSKKYCRSRKRKGSRKRKSSIKKQN